MTVRWKPLLILSGLFVVIALGGLIAFATLMNARGTADILARARTERRTGEFEKAKVDYRRAVDLDGKSPELHEEIADFYDEWARKAPAEKRAELHALAMGSLGSAIKHGPKRVGPRRKLLAEALRIDDVNEQTRRAKELITIDPTDRDSHYVLASEELSLKSPNLSEVRRHLKALETEVPRRARAEWIAARLADLSQEPAKVEEILARSREIRLPNESDPVDRLALLRLRAMDVQAATDPASLSSRVDPLVQEAIAVASEPEITSSRITHISLLIQDVQRSIDKMAAGSPAAAERLKSFGTMLDQAADQIFQKAIASPSGADLGVYLAYADHLRFRDRRDRCLTVARQGLKSPAGVRQGTSEAALGLHALAIEAVLANLTDKDRYEKATPDIKALLEGKSGRFQALGHLFQGAIDLERAGMVADAQNQEVTRAEQAKLRASAVSHLKIAAAQLPGLAEAQARYGVALILANEPSMGRQYLQQAQRLGNLEPQYQIWAAWSVVQAGYPEDAEPIVARLIKEVEAGRLPAAIEGTLHLLNGEIHQARRTPADLMKAVEEYKKAFANGQDATPAVELRLAQIEVMLDRPADALKRIDWLASKGKAGPGAENLAVLTLRELKRDDDARKRLDAARAKFPDSSELAVLAATLLVKDHQAEAADKLLADFLQKVPDNVPAVQQRAQILARELDRPADARRMLSAVADRGENSAPLVQLALLELQTKDYDAVAASIDKIRKRWKDAATSDLLDAQLSLAKGDSAGASAHFNDALKKDPNNKVVQFWKAQLDGRIDPEGSSRVFETLSKENSIKEIETGLSLVAASQSALANIAMESGDVDAAIARYRQVLKDAGPGGVSRTVRWQLAAALTAKKDWPAAKLEIEAILADTRSPVTLDEKIRAATFYRLNQDDTRAMSLADEVLKADPTHSGAVVARAEYLARMKRQPEAIAAIRSAIAATTAAGKKAPSTFYLMMAAVESTVTPAETGFARALTALDEGIAARPEAMELYQAKFQVVNRLRGPDAALAFVEERAKSDPTGDFRRMLATTYRERGDYASAARVAGELATEHPDDPASPALQIRMLAAESAEAARRGDRASSKKLLEKAGTLVEQAKGRFKTDPTFTQLECELEMRRGDFNRALALSQEVDHLSKNSPAGPLLRAAVFEAKQQPREAAAAYAEALARNPRIPEARLQLARLSLRSGQTDEAIRQAKYLIDGDSSQPVAAAALLVEARAMASQPGTADQVARNRASAIEKLAAAIKAKPDLADAYALTADIHMMNGDRTRAVAALRAELKAIPSESNALAVAIQILTEPRAKNQPAPAADLEDARALATAFAEGDTKGDRMLAASTGYSRAGQLDLALPWAEKAAARLQTPFARLTLGDLLLTMSESQPESSRSRDLLERALAQYDKILADQPDAIEAVNNKAWILHSYMGRSQAALELAQALMQRVDPAILPGEFFDTLGSIQEKLGRTRDAEESYKKGLGKSPDHPVLNYHMGALMAAGGDKSRSRKAADHLRIAQAASDRLPADIAAKLDTLLKQVDR
jgi:predicted Zn-dependent protease